MQIIFLVGCAGAVNMKNADRYYDAALRSEWSGDYDHSKEMYFRSFVNARSGSASDEYISATLYGYGRMLGYTCDFEKSLEALKESLLLERGVAGAITSNVTKRLSELGRLSLAMGSYAEASRYFSEAAPKLESLGMLESDPMGYAIYLEDYIKALELSGSSKEAEVTLSKVKAIRKQNIGVAAKFKPVYYEAACKNKT